MISYFTIVFYCKNVHILQINVNCFVKGRSVLVSFNELKKIMCNDAALVEMHQWDWNAVFFSQAIKGQYNVCCFQHAYALVVNCI